MSILGNTFQDIGSIDTVGAIYAGRASMNDYGWVTDGACYYDTLGSGFNVNAKLLIFKEQDGAFGPVAATFVAASNVTVILAGGVGTINFSFTSPIYLEPANYFLGITGQGLAFDGGFLGEGFTGSGSENSLFNSVYAFDPPYANLAGDGSGGVVVPNSIPTVYVNYNKASGAVGWLRA